jgi:hypothetical protein
MAASYFFLPTWISLPALLAYLAHVLFGKAHYHGTARLAFQQSINTEICGMFSLCVLCRAARAFDTHLCD